jgi:hypothetical protein
MDIRYLGKVLIGRVLIFKNQYPIDILMGTSHFYLGQLVFHLYFHPFYFFNPKTFIHLGFHLLLYT